MRVTDISDKIKQLPDVPRDVFIFMFVALILLSGYLSYSIAFGNAMTPPHIVITQGHIEAASASSTSDIGASGAVGETGKYVGSRSGHSYYLPTCSGVKRIKEANKVWFQSASEAASRGYKPATNCKEMQ